jgi:hypothetical protein
MFGMLDYRAHKLYWLLTLPLRIIARLLFLLAVAVRHPNAVQAHWPP